MTGVPALADPRASRALLVGVSHYPRMGEERQLPAVENNLADLADALRDERVWGLPGANCTVLHQPPDEDAVLTELRRHADAAEDALFFYYAGHGLVDPAAGGELCLALPGAYEPGGAHISVGYPNVRRELLVTAAHLPHKVVVLDCCWGGLALRGPLGETGGPATEIEGTAVLTAAASTRRALSPPGRPRTAFTDALLGILWTGLRNGEPLLDVGSVFNALKTEMAERARQDARTPIPQLGCTGDGARLVLARNPAVAAGGPDETAPGGPATEDGRAPDAAQAVADTVRELRRAGRYEEARLLQRRAALTGDAPSVRALATELRRMGHYTKAAELESGGR